MQFNYSLLAVFFVCCRSVTSARSRLSSAGVKSRNPGTSKMQSQSTARYIVSHL